MSRDVVDGMHLSHREFALPMHLKLALPVRGPVRDKERFLLCVVQGILGDLDMFPEFHREEPILRLHSPCTIIIDSHLDLSGNFDVRSLQKRYNPYICKTEIRLYLLSLTWFKRWSPCSRKIQAYSTTYNTSFSPLISIG
jgi:hypothetical protein